MTQHSLTKKVLATLLVLSLQSLFIPVSAEEQVAVLSGTVLSSENQTPLQGAKLHVGDPETGKVYSSPTIGESGSFEVRDLPPATYEVAVESDGHLYVVSTPVTLAPGQSQNVNVAVNQDMADPPGKNKKKRRGGTGVWENPATATLIIVAAAFFVGWGISELQTDSTASPSE
jgi:hypothetical protein